ncbi:MAG TPA: hypothetical protein VFB88_22270 [Xanthobacteraceae bacterium]|nr:hypothetical protein [Xanthobacteraceae bacterium]
MPASYNVHPEFGFLCPTPRFHRRVRLVLAGFVAAGLGAGVLAATYSSRQEMTTNRVDAPSVAVTMPATVLASPQGTQALAGKPGCVSDTQSDANCFSVKPRKPRMVRVATDRPALAGVALGRTAPTQVLIDTAPAPARAETALANASDAEVATASTTVPEKRVATPKKAKKMASRRAPRRDPYWYGAPSWREVEYQRGGYGRGGFTLNFW